MARKPKRRPDRGRFLFGVLLTIGYIFLTVSLVSYSPVDSPLNVVQPSGVGKPFNLCGSTGAALADWLIQSLGVGAWFLLIPLCLRLVSYWTRRELTFSVLKTIGVLLILIALSGLVNLFFPNLSIGSLTGPGGRLGAVVLFFLEPRFATLGLKIFFFFLLAGGMILACNTSLLRFLLLVTGIQPLAELLTEIFLGPKIYR